MKILYIGCVEFSKKILERLIDLKANIIGIVTKRRSDFNADFADLSDIAMSNNINYRYTTDINSKESVNWIKNLKPDIILCFGFSQILKKELLHSAPMGVLGFHPAKLPQNKGRHPIVWALVLGLEKTASTFFFMDEGVDSGDILSQKEIEIDYKDNSRSLYDKITATALTQVDEFLPQLQNKTYKRIPQDYTKTTYLRKRDKNDGQIDFSLGSRTIYNLVRGLSNPYLGAHILYRDREIKVWEAKEVTLGKKDAECGEVLDITNNQILVKCFDNSILLTEHEFKELPKVGERLI